MGLHLRRMYCFSTKSWAHGKLMVRWNHVLLKNDSNYNGFGEMKKDEGIWRCDPRYKNRVFLNPCFDQVRRIGSVLVHVSQLWCSRPCGVLKNRLRSRTRVATFKFQNALGSKNRPRSRTRVTILINSTENINTKSSEIGIQCSGSKKCSQRYEIDHFCLGIFPFIQPSEILS